MLHVLQHASTKGTVWGIVVLLVFLAMLMQTGREWICTCRKPASLVFPKVAPVLAAICGGSFGTVFLAHHIGLGAVVASSIAGILAAWLFPKQATIAFCGSFVGMLSLESFPHMYQLTIASLVAAAAFILGGPLFTGFGGKLGTTAFVGCVATAWFTNAPLIEASLPGRQLGLMILAVSIVAALAAYIISIRLKAGPVMGSALVGLFAGLLLPLLPIGSEGPLLAVVAFCASFAGMANRTRIPNEGYMLLAGLITGIVFIFASPSLGGAGGKLGTIAFVATLATREIATWKTDALRLLAFTANTLRAVAPQSEEEALVGEPTS